MYIFGCSCGIRFKVRLRFRVNVTVMVSINVSVRVKLRLKVLVTRLTSGVLHAVVREWLVSSHFIVLIAFEEQLQVNECDRGQHFIFDVAFLFSDML